MTTLHIKSFNPILKSSCVASSGHKNINPTIDPFKKLVRKTLCKNLSLIIQPNRSTKLF